MVCPGIIVTFSAVALRAEASIRASCAAWSMNRSVPSVMAAFFTVQAKAGVVSSGFFSSAFASSVLGGSALSDVPATFAQAIDPSASRSSAIVGLSSVMPFTVAVRPILRLLKAIAFVLASEPRIAAAKSSAFPVKSTRIVFFPPSTPWANVMSAFSFRVPEVTSISSGSMAPRCGRS